MKTRHHRNRLYLTEKEQETIRDYPILLGGSGIGSNIAECALRLGFQNITIIDGDKVELSNLNRQNYTENDISTNKVDALARRLRAIDRDANITTHNRFLTTENIEYLIKKKYKIAINALDFTSDIPLLFDKTCLKKNIPVLHPYNLGWGGLATIISPSSPELNTITNSNQEFNELNMVEYASNYLKSVGTPQTWIDDIVKQYKNEKEDLSPPQLSVASWTVAAMCTHILFNIATDKKIKQFPEFYFSTIMNN